jgi:hypothetical protein
MPNPNKNIPIGLYPDLMDLIDATYLDRIDEIISAREDGDIINVVARDGSKRLAIEITDNDIVIGLLNPTSQFAEQPDPIEPILTQLKPIGDATFTEWFTTLQGLMQESDNLVEFRDKLTNSYPDLDAAEFKQAMLDASIVAGMRGYDDANDSQSSFAMSGESLEFNAFGDECLEMLVSSILNRYTSESLQLNALAEIL